MSDYQSQEFRAMVVKTAGKIEPDDLKNLKSLCKDCIGQRDLSKITSAIELFDEIEKKKKLNPNDVSFLIYLLEIGCKNGPMLLPDVQLYRNKWSSAQGLSEEKRQIAQYISNNLGRCWKNALRFTGLPDEQIDILVEDNPGKTQESIYKGFCKCFSDPTINASVENVLEALEKAGMKKLADEIKKCHYN
ncbi:hypothetical protein EGW08_019567 [Elysia chlorotica]|uniref:Death domain-containing protein n=1 Tax=Elysia chlorotica TaxID=188477 RepID=A0A3S0ZQ39_ELYCH|nr:hypothetical protein EGW08_019567 [Elysia chlorotica]